MKLYDLTFYDLIQRNARSFGDRTAWLEADDQRQLSFGQYRAQVDRLAAGLRAAGVGKGDRIGVLGKNSMEYFLLYGASAALGAIMLPINWRLSAGEVRFNLNDCTPRVLFADAEYQEMIDASRQELPSVGAFFNLKADQGRYASFDGLMAEARGFEPAVLDSDDGFVIIHTAAVAGRPRGALLSHGNALCADMHFGHLFGLTPADVHLSLLPLFHVGGLFMATGAYHAGACNLNMSKFDAGRAAALIAEHSVSLLFDFPPILASLLAEQEQKGASLASLRAVIGLGTAEVIGKYQALTGGTYYCMYGQTETSCLATYGRYDDAPGSAGRILPLAAVELVDEADQPVAVGQVGEIAVRGPMVFKGYWNLPEETARAFRSGWHHTGDLGRFDANGFLWFEGRKAEKELIKPGGENVYPAEVENAILAHPAVAAVVVFGVPDAKWKEGIKAVCQLKTGQHLQPRELIRFVGSRIASFKKPQYVEFVGSLPRLPDGTPDRARVKAQFGAGRS